MVHLDEGFDFLGFNVRRYGQKLLIKPSDGAVRRIRKAGRRGARPARSERHSGDPHDQPDHAGVVRLLPGRGVHGDVRRAGRYLWQLLYKWALYRHNHRSRH